LFAEVLPLAVPEMSGPKTTLRRLSKLIFP